MKGAERLALFAKKLFDSRRSKAQTITRNDVFELYTKECGSLPPKEGGVNEDEYERGISDDRTDGEKVIDTTVVMIDEIAIISISAFFVSINNVVILVVVLLYCLLFGLQEILENENCNDEEIDRSIKVTPENEDDNIKNENDGSGATMNDEGAGSSSEVLVEEGYSDIEDDGADGQGN